MRNGYAKLGNAMRRPRGMHAGTKRASSDIGSAIAAERARAARIAKANTKRKSK